MDKNTETIDVVVNHFNKAQAPHIRYMALYAMAFLCKDQPENLRIIFVDGSPFADEELKNGLMAFGVEYIHSGRELSFGQIYDLGIKASSSPVVVTLANDIFIEAKQVRMLAEEIKGGIGCAIPYLSFSDYGAQIENRLPHPKRCFPSRMTINVNAFSRAALEKIGFIPEQMTGCYNDVIMFIRLRQEGYSILMRNVGHIVHLGQQTIKTGVHKFNYEADAALFARQYPKYWRKGAILFHKVAQSWTTRIIYGVVESLPARLVEKLGLWNRVWSIEPYICAERGTFKLAIKRCLKI